MDGEKTRTRFHDRKRHWTALVGALLLSTGYAALVGPFLASEMALLGFIALLVGGYCLLNPRSPSDSKFTISMLIGVGVLVGFVTAYGITLNDFGPVVGAVLAAAIASVVAERLLDFVPYFAKRQEEAPPTRWI